MDRTTPSAGDAGGGTYTHGTFVEQSQHEAALLERTRSGDMTAYAELFALHRRAALAAALRVAPPQAAEDLVSDAFTNVLRALRAGKGPRAGFRTYVVTAVRNAHLNSLRTSNRENLTPDYEEVSHRSSFEVDHERRDSAALVGQALQTLPERWQQVLWLGAVEGHSHQEIGERLDIKPNAVAALAFRAREGLREAYLAKHLCTVQAPACREAVTAMPAFVRGSLSARRKDEVQAHLDDCRACAGALSDLHGINTELGVLLAPLLLTGAGVAAGTGLVTGGAASGSGGIGAAGSTSTGTAATAGTASGVSLGGILGAAAAAVVAGGIAVAGGLGPAVFSDDAPPTSRAAPLEVPRLADRLPATDQVADVDPTRPRPAPPTTSRGPGDTLARTGPTAAPDRAAGSPPAETPAVPNGQETDSPVPGPGQVTLSSPAPVLPTEQPTEQAGPPRGSSTSQAPAPAPDRQEDTPPRVTPAPPEPESDDPPSQSGWNPRLTLSTPPAEGVLSLVRIAASDLSPGDTVNILVPDVTGPASILDAEGWNCTSGGRPYRTTCTWAPSGQETAGEITLGYLVAADTTVTATLTATNDADPSDNSIRAEFAAPAG